jgi:hypothetical protein
MLCCAVRLANQPAGGQRGAVRVVILVLEDVQVEREELL